MSSDARPPGGGPEVYVTGGSLGDPTNPEPTYHEEPGHYGADEAVVWADAVDAGASPCDYCCESFEVVDGPGEDRPGFGGQRVHTGRTHGGDGVWRRISTGRLPDTERLRELIRRFVL